MIDDGDLVGGKPAPAGSFQVTTDRDGGRILLRLRGELDHRARRPFDRVLPMLAWDGAWEVVLDLRGLTFMDKDGQKELILLWRRSVSAGIGFRLIEVSEDLRERLRMTGVDKLLQVA